MKRLALVPRIANAFVVLAVVLYVVGFVICNLRLSYFGVVGPTFLRTRYIMVGLLFLVFCCSVGYLVYGLIKTTRQCIRETAIKTAGQLILHSVQNFFVVFLVCGFAGLLAGEGAGPLGSWSGPHLSALWNAWLAVEPRTLLRQSVGMWSWLLAFVVVLILAFFVVNPKDDKGERPSRRSRLRSLLKSVFQNPIRPLAAVAGLLALLYAPLLVMSLSSLLLVTGGGPSASNGTSFLSEGLLRFLVGVALLYLSVAFYVIASFIRYRNSRGEDDVDLSWANPLTGFNAWIHIAAIAAVLVVPSYALGVYPYVPQQIGGGLPVKVEASFRDNRHPPLLLASDDSLYIVDRGPDNTLFLVANKQTGQSHITEVHNEELRSISYR